MLLGGHYAGAADTVNHPEDSVISVSPLHSSPPVTQRAHAVCCDSLHFSAPMHRRGSRGTAWLVEPLSRSLYLRALLPLWS